MAGGDYLAGLGKLDEGRLAAEKAIAVDPRAFRAWQVLGVIRARQKQPGAARAAFEKVVELRPADANGWVHLGVACHDAGDPQRAAECFKRALEIDPNNARAKDPFAKVSE